MAAAQATSQVFLNQVAPCEGRSPLYAELLRRYADDPVAGEIVGPEPEWDAPLRLLGGLHYLVLGGRANWDDPLERHRGFLSDFVATQGVQTNEVQRSWVSSRFSFASLSARVPRRSTSWSWVRVRA